MNACLIALDWGTSNLRASLLDGSGGVLETRSAPAGVMALQEGQFAAALVSLCGSWIEQHRCPMIASGMIGSRQGWKEAPYLDCPADIDRLAARLTPVDVDGCGTLHIVAGLRCLGEDRQHDVMRGEETQLLGAKLEEGSCCVLPGTHSKWAWMGGDGTIQRFETYMTGELYGLLIKHGILGRLMKLGVASPDRFATGVRLGLDQHAKATHAIFAARTAGLMGSVPPDALPDFLSGILIGVEIGSATARVRPRSVTLLGDDALCARYAAALRIADLPSIRAVSGATTRGQWLVAKRAGLLSHAGMAG